MCFLPLPQSASLAVNITLAFPATPRSSLLIQGEFMPIALVEIKDRGMQYRIHSALNLTWLESVGEHL